MDKLNIFDGYLSKPPGTEDRLTWALMNLIRMSPIIRAAFLDLVRDKQEQPNHAGSWRITLELYPGDTMTQARKFWSKVDTG